MNFRGFYIKMDLITKYVFYFIILSCLTACNTQDKNIGDACKLPVRGTGICKKIADCPKARVQNSLGIKPNICNRKAGIVVCCDGPAPPTPTQQIEPRIATQQLQPRIAPMENSFTQEPSTRNLRKCQQKCLEYSAPVQTSLFSAPLSIDRTIIHTQLSNCLFESKPLIYGGSLAIHGEFPHMALLGHGNPRNWLCGGSLISEQFVLTAAHCFVARGSINIVRLGELNIMKPEFNSEPQDIVIEKVFIHPEYVRTQVYNDIALVKLVRKVTLGPYIRPACLWNKFEISQNKTIATGWGATENDPHKINDDLLKVGLNIVEHNKCKEMYKNYTFSKLREIRRNIVCAANTTGGDTCQGDSGGPLEITDPQNKCIHYIIGITSAGRGCGSAVPGIYTRVSDYVDWIEGIVWP